MTKADRLLWMDHYAATGSAGAVCAAFGISRPTFRKWFRRFAAEGAEGLEERSRRPATAPGRKVFAAEEEAILRLRREQGFGPRRIRAALRADGISLSTDTIAKVLRRLAVPSVAVKGRGATAAPVVDRPARIPEADDPACGPTPSDALADAIAALIIEGRFRPGERLSEAALGALLGSGRAGIRAALQRLAPTGLVVLHRHRGAVVNRPSPAEIEQAYAARRLIEAETIGHLCRHCTAHDLLRLRRHVDAQAEAARAGQRGTVIRLLTEFHVVIAALGENRILADFVKTLASKTSLAVLLYDHVGSSCAIAEHRDMVDLIAAGDVASAQVLIRRHLAANRRRLPGVEGGARR